MCQESCMIDLMARQLVLLSLEIWESRSVYIHYYIILYNSFLRVVFRAILSKTNTF